MPSLASSVARDLERLRMPARAALVVISRVSGCLARTALTLTIAAVSEARR